MAETKIQNSFVQKVLPILVILAAYVSIQMFAISAPFFPLDDPQEIFYVRNLESSWQLFCRDCFGLFRPIKNLLFALFSLFPSDMTWACRVIAIAVGCVSFFPVLALLRRVFHDERKALLAAMVWLLSPTLVSSAAWLSCVNIQVMCALGSLAIVLHDKAFDGEQFRPIFVVMAVFCLFGACASYEQAVAVGPLIVVFDFYLRPWRCRAKRTILIYGFYVLLLSAYLILRRMVGAASTLNGSFVEATRLDMFFASAYFTCQHFIAWFYPFGKMSPFGAYSPRDVSLLCLIGSWLCVCCLVALALLLRKRSPIVALGVAFALLAFLPVSNILGFGNGPYGDYYLGLPSMGLSILVICVCHLLSSSKSLWHSAFNCFVIIVLGIRMLAIGEAAYWAWLWADGARACKSGIKAYPCAFWNRLQYLSICYNSGNMAELHDNCEWLESYLGADSEHMALVYLYRALEAMNYQHNATKAMQNLDNASRVDKKRCYNVCIHFYRGCAFEDLLGDEKAAEVEYRAVTSRVWTVDTPPVADRLARILAIRGDIDEAEELWEKASRLAPDDVGIQYNLMQVKNAKRSKK